MTSTNAEKFIEAFTDVEKSLNRIINTTEYISYSKKLQIAAKLNNVVKNHLECLREYGELRNAIVHNSKGVTKVIAEPSYEVTEDIVRIAELLKRDQNALTYASTPVLMAKETDQIVTAYNNMRKLGVTKLPVYGDRYLGLISMTDIAGYLIEGGNKEDMLKVLLPRCQKNRAIFMKENATLQLVAEEFDLAHKEKRSTPVVLITKNGNQNEMPLGIISSYDLPKIISVLT